MADGFSIWLSFIKCSDPQNWHHTPKHDPQFDKYIYTASLVFFKQSASVCILGPFHSSGPGLLFASYCVWLGLFVLFCFCLFRVSMYLRGLHWLLSSFLSCILSLLACNCPVCLLFLSACRWQVGIVTSSSLWKLKADALCIFLTPQYLAVFSTQSLNDYGTPLR